MARRCFYACVVLVLSMSFALAEEFMASISKVEGDKVTFHKTSFKDKKFEKGEAMTLPVADNVKVVKGKFDFKAKKFEPGDALAEGLKNERFKNIGEKGVFAQIVTDADNKKITEIRVMEFKGKGKGKKQDK